MREGGNPFGDPQARALRETQREAEEEGVGGQEARLEKDEENEPVADGTEGPVAERHAESGQGEESLGPFCFADGPRGDQEPGDRGEGGAPRRGGREGAGVDGQAAARVDRAVPEREPSRACGEGAGRNRRPFLLPPGSAFRGRGRVPRAGGDRVRRRRVSLRHGPRDEGTDAQGGRPRRRQAGERGRPAPAVRLMRGREAAGP